jgi:hypothetical protein
MLEEQMSKTISSVVAGPLHVAADDIKILQDGQFVLSATIQHKNGEPFGQRPREAKETENALRIVKLLFPELPPEALKKMRALAQQIDTSEISKSKEKDVGQDSEKDVEVAVLQNLGPMLTRCIAIDAVRKDEKTQLHFRNPKIVSDVTGPNKFRFEVTGLNYNIDQGVIEEVKAEKRHARQAKAEKAVKAETEYARSILAKEKPKRLTSVPIRVLISLGLITTPAASVAKDGKLAPIVETITKTANGFKDYTDIREGMAKLYEDFKEATKIEDFDSVTKLYEKFKESTYPSIMVLEKLLNIKITIKVQKIGPEPENELPKGGTFGMHDV